MFTPFVDHCRQQDRPRGDAGLGQCVRPRRSAAYILEIFASSLEAFSVASHHGKALCSMIYLRDQFARELQQDTY